MNTKYSEIVFHFRMVGIHVFIFLSSLFFSAVEGMRPEMELVVESVRKWASILVFVSHRYILWIARVSGYAIGIGRQEYGELLRPGYQSVLTSFKDVHSPRLKCHSKDLLKTNEAFACVFRFCEIRTSDFFCLVTVLVVAVWWEKCLTYAWQPVLIW